MPMFARRVAYSYPYHYIPYQPPHQPLHWAAGAEGYEFISRFSLLSRDPLFFPFFPHFSECFMLNFALQAI